MEYVNNREIKQFVQRFMIDDTSLTLDEVARLLNTVELFHSVCEDADERIDDMLEGRKTESYPSPLRD